MVECKYALSFVPQPKHVSTNYHIMKSPQAHLRISNSDASVFESEYMTRVSTLSTKKTVNLMC